MTETSIDLAALICRIQTLVSERYILERDVAAISASIDGVAADLAGEGPDRIAAILTDRLQQANNDHHLRVRHQPGGAVSDFDATEHHSRYAVEAARNSGGVRQVRLLDGGVGLLEIAPSLAPVHLAEPYITAAFTLLGSVNGLVLDLRDGNGGTPETVALLCGHLFGTDPVHLQDVVGRDGSLRQFWTSPAAHRIDAPIRVLTSHDTFSGCEELAYDLQAQQRAVIVGETTRGGAHPVAAFKVADVLELHLPTAMSINAITGTNWEQVGVVPERSCPAGYALQSALSELQAISTS